MRPTFGGALLGRSGPIQRGGWGRGRAGEKDFPRPPRSRIPVLRPVHGRPRIQEVDPYRHPVGPGRGAVRGGEPPGDSALVARSSNPPRPPPLDFSRVLRASRGDGGGSGPAAEVPVHPRVRPHTPVPPPKVPGWTGRPARSTTTPSTPDTSSGTAASARGGGSGGRPRRGRPRRRVRDGREGVRRGPASPPSRRGRPARIGPAGGSVVLGPPPRASTPRDHPRPAPPRRQVRRDVGAGPRRARRAAAGECDGTRRRRRATLGPTRGSAGPSRSARGGGGGRREEAARRATREVRRRRRRRREEGRRPTAGRRGEVARLERPKH